MLYLHEAYRCGGSFDVQYDMFGAVDSLVQLPLLGNSHFSFLNLLQRNIKQFSPLYCLPAIYTKPMEMEPEPEEILS